MRVIHFTFLAVAMLLCGSLLSSLTAGALQRPPSFAEPTRRWERPAERRALPRARLYALLGLPPEATVAVGPAKSAAVTTPSPLVLLGTLAPTFAAVFDPVSKRAHTVAPGDVIGDDEIAAVNHRSILVNREGRLLELSLNAAPSPPVPPTVTSASANTSITRAELSRAMTSMPELAQQVQIVPAFTNGEFRGFRVVRLTPGSLLARAGLMSGDVLRRVNGLELSKPENLGQLLASASSVTQVNVELDRNGAALQWSVALTP